jgi:hypothetical protein
MQHNSDHRVTTRSCECGFLERVHSLTEHGYQIAKSATRRRCKCGKWIKKKDVIEAKNKAFTYNYYTCDCGIKETRIELSKETFEKLLVKAKLENKSGNPGYESNLSS